MSEITEDRLVDSNIGSVGGHVTIANNRYIYSVLTHQQQNQQCSGLLI